MDELRDEDKDLDDDILKKPLEDDDEDLDDIAVDGVPLKPVIPDEEDVDDIDALIDEEEEGLDDFGAEDYNAPDND